MFKKLLGKQKSQKAEKKIEKSAFFDFEDKENAPNSAAPDSSNSKDMRIDQINTNQINSREYFQKANQCQKEENYDEACCLYNQAVELDPNFSEAYNGWGNTLSQRGKYKEACEKYQQAVQINPRDSQAYYNWGKALSDQDKPLEAIENYMAAINIKPDYEDAYRSWAKTLLELGEYDKAVLVYNQLEEFYPTDSDTYLNWGNALRNQGNNDEAIDKYIIANDMSCNNTHIIYNWGLALMNKKSYEEAILLFAQIINLNPDFMHAYNQWGQSLQYQGRYNEAIVKYKQYLDVYLNDYEAYTNWGFCLYCSGIYDEAILKYQKAIEISPMYIFAHINLGLALFHRKEHSQILKGYIQGIYPMISSTHIKDVVRAYEDRIQQIQAQNPLDGQTQRIDAIKEVLNMLVENLNRDVVFPMKEIEKDKVRSNRRGSKMQEKEEDCLSDFRLLEYYTFLYKGFNNLFCKIFRVDGDSLTIDEQIMASTVSLVTKYLPPLHTVPSMAKIFPMMSKIAPMGINANDQIEIRKTNTKYKRFIANFTTYNEIKQIAVLLSHKLTVFRKDILIGSYGKKVNKKYLDKINGVQSGLSKMDIESKSEEYAFLDLVVLVLICFLEGAEVEKPECSEQKTEKVAEAIFLKMEQYSKQMISERNEIYNQCNCM